MESSKAFLATDNEPADKYSYYNYIKSSFQITSIYLIDSIPITYTFYMLKYKNDLYLSSALGLGLTYQCFSFSFIYGFGDAFGVLGSRLYGSGDFSAFNVLCFKSIVLIFLCLVASESCMLASPHVLRWLGIDQELINRIYWLLCWNMVERAIDCFNTVGRCVIMSQDLSKVFLPMNLICLTVFFIFACIGFNYFGWGLGSYIMARYAKTITETVLQIYFLIRYAHSEMLFLPSLRELGSGVLDILALYLFCGFGLYGQIMAVEASSQFAAYSGDPSQISAYVSFINILNIFALIGCGMTCTMRTHCNYEKGQNNIKKMFWVAKIYYKYSIISGIGFGCLLYTYSYRLAIVFANDAKTVDNLASILKVYAFVLVIDYNLSFSSNFLRTLDRANEVFYCTAIYFPIVMITGASIVTYKYGMGNMGLLGCYSVGVVSTYCIIMALVYRETNRVYSQLRTSPDAKTSVIEVALMDKSKAADKMI